ncbi:thermonuclease family protein [Neoaquamicrobium sediminum]|uniref:thermonuclease family protein n=1 Tax=Neoaquamicrobium sediminum TaxID=1849104 RepID=UPI0015643476|nr:thermonuclease family protein [Mesorhizobium sediminum]NRC57281.1 thermonuclease family protein [Mesorhizobium sediminum]
MHDQHLEAVLRVAHAGVLGCLGLIGTGSLSSSLADAADNHFVVDVVLCTTSCAPVALRIWDGDTFRIGFGSGSERVRLADIDAPEIEGKCAYERELARRSQLRLAELLSGRPIVIVRQGQDRHGRTLAILSIASGNVGGILVREGLARNWHGRREPWCG